MCHPLVTCSQCGSHHLRARWIAEPGTFHVICSRCEAVLKVEVTLAEIEASADVDARGADEQCETYGVAVAS